MFADKGIYTEKAKTAAFSGHRKIVPPTQQQLFGGGVPPQRYMDDLRDKLDKTVAKLIAEGYDTFLCGMAAGFDLMAGMAVCRRIEAGDAVNLLALVPHPGQAARFGPQERLDYEKVISMASDVFTVCPEYRKECFHMRNDLLVAQSSALVCYYDGSPGGTHYTVRKALREGRRIINLF